MTKEQSIGYIRITTTDQNTAHQVKGNKRLKAKMALAATLLNEDDSVTPANNLPIGFLVEESAAGLEDDFQAVEIY